MSDEDIEYLANYKPDALYTIPAKNGTGAYAALVGDSEQVIGEIDVTDRCKLAVSAFYVQNHSDFGSPGEDERPIGPSAGGCKSLASAIATKGR